MLNAQHFFTILDVFILIIGALNGLLWTLDILLLLQCIYIQEKS